MFETTSEAELHEALRECEVMQICRLFAPGSKILELGGGDGLQAKVLSDAGFEVTSIDIPSRQSRGRARFPVMDYEGGRIPFPDATFDGVFSSNVLEHIPNLSFSLSELRRVLKAGGIGVHILPTPIWRFWTTFIHYPWLIHRTFAKTRGPATVAMPRPSEVKRSRWDVMRQALALGFAAHGEYPNALAELHYFRRAVWLNTFDVNGFEVVSCSSTGIFYTGQLLATSLSVSDRRTLARLLGSACSVFVTRTAGE